MQYVPSSGGNFRLAQSAGGDGSGADIIIPDEARWDAWVLAPGDQRILATTAPLPAGGQWTALFGSVSDNGDGTVTYTAPTDVPPYGLDEVAYGDGPTGPNIQLMVFIPPRVSPPASLAPQWQPQPVALAALTLLRRVPPDLRGDYARTVRWLRRRRSAAGPSRRWRGGYVLPAWADDADVEVYTPSASPRGVKPAALVVYKGPGPVNPYPPSPTDTPRSRRATVGTWQAVPARPSGWKSGGRWAGAISPTDARTIRALYGTSPDAGSCTLLNRQSQDWVYHQVQYTDHYKCADSGTNWIYVSTTLCDQQGEGKLFNPKWLSVEEGWPPNGSPIWTPPQCHDIHVQQSPPPQSHA